MLKRMITPMLALLLFFAAETNAQLGVTPKIGLGIGPVVGYQKAGDADNGRFMFGAALRLRLSEALGAEASINYRQEKYGNGAVTVKSWPIMVTGMLYPIPFVYGLLGAGWYNTTFDYSNNVKNSVTALGFSLGDKNIQRFGWHVGAGLELDTGTGTKLFGDIRYVFLNYSLDNLATQAVNSLKDLNSNFFVVSVGLLFGF